MKSTEFMVQFVEEPEGEEPIESLSSDMIQQAVVHSMDWTTETLLSQLRRQNIQIDPKFQRRDAWTKQRKSRFIESLILGLPIPQIVLAESKERKGQFIVLDGKQRLLTLLQFTGQAVGRNNSFALTNLDIREDLNKKTYADMESNFLFNEDMDAFLNQTIRAVVIRNWPNADFLHLVFVRLNMGSVSLSPQELREALFPGPFIDFADERASESPALRHLLKISEPDFRMRDVEILTRFLAFSFYLPIYTGNFKAFMDFTCQDLNKNWNSREEEIRRTANQFDEAVEAGIKIFGPDNVGRKWIGDSYESRLNRAVLDVLSFYFSDPDIRDRSLARASAVEEAFRLLCTQEDFRSSIERTTKSITATSTRFNLWGQVLRNATDLEFNVPMLESGRIRFGGLWG